MASLVAPQDQSTVRYNNTKMILDIIRHTPGVSRSSIARITGMSPTSATRIVGDLQQLQLVKETTAISGGVGRKAVSLEINPGLFCCVGIDISETKLSICLQCFGGEVVGRLTCPRENDAMDGPQVVEQLYGMYRQLLADTGFDPDKVVAVGIGALGTVDVETGNVIYADLLNWANVPITRLCGERFGLPCYADNDVKCALIGEIDAGLVGPLEDTVLLSFGRGVGGAIYNSNGLVRGVSNSAGEIGHTIIDYTDGHLCSCGRRGCVAAYLTEANILEHARRLFPPAEGLDHIMEAFQAGEAWAIPQVERICGYLSVTISNTICILNPQNIILGGKLFNNYPFLFDLAIEKYTNMRYEPLKTSTRFYRSSLKGSSTSVGGACLATDQYVQRLLREMP